MIALYIFIGVWLAGPLFSGLYLLTLLRKDVKFIGWHRWYAAEFWLVSEKSWYARQWKDWSGVGLFGYMITRESSLATRQHESRHCLQSLIGGGWLYVSMVAHSILIWLFQQELHSYLDNWAERDARRYARQPVYIDRSRWRQGPTDRWPWW